MTTPDLTNVTIGCGEYRGYQRHKRRGEDPCQFCLDANAAYMRDLRKRNPTSREYNRRLVAAQSRALWRLERAHPDEFHAYVAEEMAKA